MAAAGHPWNSPTETNSTTIATNNATPQELQVCQDLTLSAHETVHYIAYYDDRTDITPLMPSPEMLVDGAQKNFPNDYPFSSPGSTSAAGRLNDADPTYFNAAVFYDPVARVANGANITYNTPDPVELLRYTTMPGAAAFAPSILTTLEPPATPTTTANFTMLDGDMNANHPNGSTYGTYTINSLTEYRVEFTATAIVWKINGVTVHAIPRTVEWSIVSGGGSLASTAPLPANATNVYTAPATPGAVVLHAAFDTSQESDFLLDCVEPELTGCPPANVMAGDTFTLGNTILPSETVTYSATDPGITFASATLPGGSSNLVTVGAGVANGTYTVTLSYTLCGNPATLECDITVGTPPPNLCPPTPTLTGCPAASVEPGDTFTLSSNLPAGVSVTYSATNPGITFNGSPLPGNQSNLVTVGAGVPDGNYTITLAFLCGATPTTLECDIEVLTAMPACPTSFTLSGCPTNGVNQGESFTLSNDLPAHASVTYGSPDPEITFSQTTTAGGVDVSVMVGVPAAGNYDIIVTATCDDGTGPVTLDRICTIQVYAAAMEGCPPRAVRPGESFYVELGVPNTVACAVSQIAGATTLDLPASIQGNTPMVVSVPEDAVGDVYQIKVLDTVCEFTVCNIAIDDPITTVAIGDTIDYKVLNATTPVWSITGSGDAVAEVNSATGRVKFLTAGVFRLCVHEMAQPECQDCVTITAYCPETNLCIEICDDAAEEIDPLCKRQLVQAVKCGQTFPLCLPAAIIGQRSRGGNANEIEWSRSTAINARFDNNNGITSSANAARIAGLDCFAPGEDGYFEFVLTYEMLTMGNTWEIGINDTKQEGWAQSDVLYGFRRVADGTIHRYENDVDFGVVADTPRPGDLLRISYEEGTVKYWYQGRLHATNASPAGCQLCPDVRLDKANTKFGGQQQVTWNVPTGGGVIGADNVYRTPSNIPPGGEVVITGEYGARTWEMVFRFGVPVSFADVRKYALDTEFTLFYLPKGIPREEFRLAVNEQGIVTPDVIQNPGATAILELERGIQFSAPPTIQRGEQGRFITAPSAKLTEQKMEITATWNNVLDPYLFDRLMTGVEGETVTGGRRFHFGQKRKICGHAFVLIGRHTQCPDKAVVIGMYRAYNSNGFSITQPALNSGNTYVSTQIKLEALADPARGVNGAPGFIEMADVECASCVTSDEC